MQKHVAVLLAPGFEEIEAVVVMDILRRAGVVVLTVGVQGKSVTGSHNITLVADITISELNIPLDACILPGGNPGAPNLARSQEVSLLLKKIQSSGALIAAICAAPAVVLGPLGLLDHKNATGFRGTEKKFPPSARFKQNPVVIDGNLITSQGPGTVFPFAFAVVEYLSGKEMTDKLRQEMMCQDFGANKN